MFEKKAIPASGKSKKITLTLIVNANFCLYLEIEPFLGGIGYSRIDFVPNSAAAALLGTPSVSNCNLSSTFSNDSVIDETIIRLALHPIELHHAHVPHSNRLSGPDLLVGVPMRNIEAC